MHVTWLWLWILFVKIARKTNGWDLTVVMDEMDTFTLLFDETAAMGGYDLHG